MPSLSGQRQRKANCYDRTTVGLSHCQNQNRTIHHVACVALFPRSHWAKGTQELEFSPVIRIQKLTECLETGYLNRRAVQRLQTLCVVSIDFETRSAYGCDADSRIESNLQYGPMILSFRRPRSTRFDTLLNALFDPLLDALSGEVLKAKDDLHEQLAIMPSFEMISEADANYDSAEVSLIRNIDYGYGQKTGATQLQEGACLSSSPPQKATSIRLLSMHRDGGFRAAREGQVQHPRVPLVSKPPGTQKVEQSDCGERNRVSKTQDCRRHRKCDPNPLLPRPHRIRSDQFTYRRAGLTGVFEMSLAMKRHLEHQRGPRHRLPRCAAG